MKQQTSNNTDPHSRQYRICQWPLGMIHQGSPAAAGTAACASGEAAGGQAAAGTAACASGEAAGGAGAGGRPMLLCPTVVRCSPKQT